MATYQLTKKAEREFDKIYEYSILNFGLEPAQNYVNGLEVCFETLANNPRMGKDYSHVKKEYRRYEYEPHSVYYTITKTGVRITRILGPGQDPITNLA
ncbi:type II toxin-antitoxin system RelE/ParE family toxin [Nitrospira sp. M1]